ncbi:hypothetical protein [Rubinisphaera sp. JC750]|uniref:hypothetical protein n=1 Tax=Rubinisphaera sp. JC750 TaxID=2898658 RepID=UPI001F370968|nr:hypothetical protein [Rubinisphaera sp. JC750]
MSVADAMTNLMTSLARFWEETFSGDSPVIFPGEQREASRWPTWVELAIPFANEQVERSRGLERIGFTVDAHAFVAETTDLNTARRLVDAIRDTLAGANLVVRDVDLSALPAIGWARLAEAEVRDLSRLERNVGGRPLQHFLVSLRGMAQLVEQ